MLVIVDYGMGNLGSIANMIHKLGSKSIISSDPNVIATADKLILPGVGAFDHGMINLKEKELFSVLQTKVLKEKTPILGICLGMQLMGKFSAEGNEEGLGWIDGGCVRFDFTNKNAQLRIPHMGWNEVHVVKENPLIDNELEDTRYYFVHSYHMQCNDHSQVLGTANYGYEFPCCVNHENIYGVQFHPEKSHKFGMRLLTRFMEGCQ
ncbi:MAG: imidazole glycerol phosphate synthase subunit HisH [Bacteroidota bacterium]